MEKNEPGAEIVHFRVSEATNALCVRDEFVDADATGFHLGTTAAAHLPSLLEVAQPGKFLFLGNVRDELKAGFRQMGLPAEFSSQVAGFDRAPATEPALPPQRQASTEGINPMCLAIMCAACSVLLQRTLP